jgi:hypothetical protein
MGMLERAAGERDTDAGWPAPLRAGFRFASVYFVLTYLPFPIYLVPGGGGLAAAYERAWQALVVWVGEHVLRLERPIAIVFNGSGDTTYHYVRALCAVVLAVAAALAWSAASRARRHPRLYAGLHVYLRYALAHAMLLYGLAKVLAFQFTPAEPHHLVQRLGEGSPMGLLWKMMGHSTPYTVFTGAVEVLAALLLLSRRTALAGALVAAVAMVQVVALNLCYDVPVKLLSMHLLATSLVLTAPALRGLLALLFPPAAEHGARLLRIAKPIAVVLLVVPTVLWCVFIHFQEGRGAPKPALFGLYEVESFAEDSVERPPLLTDPDYWRTFAVSSWSSAHIRALDDSERTLLLIDDPAQQRITLIEGGYPHTLRYRRPDADHLVLEGHFRGHTIRVAMRRIDPRSLPLLRRRFRWISEEPFNR